MTSPRITERIKKAHYSFILSFSVTSIMEIDYSPEIWAVCILTLQGTAKLLEMNVSLKMLFSIMFFFRSGNHLGLTVQIELDF